MTVVDFQQEGRSLVCYLFGTGQVPDGFTSERKRAQDSTNPPFTSASSGHQTAKEKVCTMCTPWAFGSGL